MGYSQFKIFPIAKDQKASLIFDKINRWLLASECRVQSIDTLEINNEKVIAIYFETGSGSPLEKKLQKKKQKAFERFRKQYDDAHNK